MLFIGDLYQLPPVVRDENEYIMKKYYQSPFFFDAFALKETNLLTIELTEVLDKKDEEFLEISTKSETLIYQRTLRKTP